MTRRAWTPCRKRVKNGEIAVMETDKTGKFTVMSQEDYLEAGDIHTVNDKEITEDELWNIQRRLNAGNSMFIKIFKNAYKSLI